MNLCEAIRTGLPIRRKGEEKWIKYPQNEVYGGFLVEDLLADDWEVKTPTIEVSYGSLLDAFCTCLDKLGQPEPSPEVLILSIAAHLGLKPYGEPDAQDLDSGSGQSDIRVREQSAAARGHCTDLGCGCPTPDDESTYAKAGRYHRAGEAVPATGRNAPVCKSREL